MTDPISPEVDAAYLEFSAKAQNALRECRELVFEAAKLHPEIGPVTETLKWGVPSYLTEKTKSGSTLRLSPTRDGKAALYVNCKTNLIDQFREIYPDTFGYEGVRGLVLQHPVADVRDELKHCIALTLTYHARKKRNHNH